ncbi:MAG: hypothetical protein KAJ19_02915 [Gammaproteobacteria bacterium]|nr:hypothetical protein [Gammaproteobacteria bacterium]
MQTIIKPDQKFAVIVDIDGTIANNNHRRHFVESEKKDWKAFNAFMHDDVPHNHVVAVLHSLMGKNMAGILATGRGEEHRELTEEWLEKWNIGYDKLYMRPAKDYRSDVIIKGELLEQIKGDGFVPYLCLDDRNSVVEMWREAGVPCFQVAEGDF